MNRIFIAKPAMSLLIAVIGAMILSQIVQVKTLDAQDYPNSIVSTDFDFIHSNDPSAFKRLEFKEKRVAEMPDKRPGEHNLMQTAFVFDAFFTDGAKIQIAVDAKFKNKEAAQKEAERYVPRMGKLPTSLRQGVRRLVVHQGGEDTTAFSDQGLIVVYAANATKRISTHDLEETIFHESVHAAWDKKYASSDRWKNAQSQDGQFVTQYGKRKPAREDLAESALFAYTLIHHPDRIPAADSMKIKKAIPARIRFVAELIPPGKPIFYPISAADEKEAEDEQEAETAPEANQQSDGKTKLASSVCSIDISTVGHLSDILSNALTVGLKKDELLVRKFLDGMVGKCESGEQLFQLAVAEFKITEDVLKQELIEFMHCNCQHAKDAKIDEQSKKTILSWKTSTKDDSP